METATGVRLRHARWRGLLIIVFAVMAMLGVQAPADAHAVGMVRIGAPSNGKFALPGNGTHPSQHTLNNGGDWSVDFFAPAGTEIKAFLSPPVPYGQIKATVESVVETCGAGKRVKINVSQNNQTIGWITYSHIANPRVSAGSTVYWGTPLGQTWMWNYKPGCWEVTQPAGVHTHIEVSNQHHYACYWPYGAGQDLAATNKLGFIGGDRLAVRQACPTTGPIYTQ